MSETLGSREAPSVFGSEPRTVSAKCSVLFSSFCRRERVSGGESPLLKKVKLKIRYKQFLELSPLLPIFLLLYPFIYLFFQNQRYAYSFYFKLTSIRTINHFLNTICIDLFSPVYSSQQFQLYFYTYLIT